MIEHIVGGLFLLWLTVDGFWVAKEVLTQPRQSRCLLTEKQRCRLKEIDRELALIDSQLDHPANPLEWSIKKSL